MADGPVRCRAWRINQVKPRTTAQVNNYLEARGLPWRIRRYAYARGAFFAVEGGNSEEWRVTVLPVARLSDLSLAGWELVLHELAEQETPTEGASR